MISANTSLAATKGSEGFALARVINSGLCVGCGLCAGLEPSDLRMKVTPRGEYLPILAENRSWNDIPTEVNSICPFSGAGADEDMLARIEFASQVGIRHSPYLGYFLRTDAAWVTDDSSRIASSAGGLAFWLANHLLRNRIVDGVCCVTECASGQPFFSYQIIRREEDLVKTRKSRYYPVEMSGALREIIQTRERLAIVALPCFAKGLRLAMQAGLLPRDSIHCIVGLFCGHLKTIQFIRYLIRCCGFRESDVVSVDFRKKFLGNRASDYGFESTIRLTDGETLTKSIRMRDVALGNWGLNSFMLKACECCDDVVAELADISFGDAWLPEFVADSRGTNLLICRRSDLAEIIEHGVVTGQIVAKPVAPEAVIASQEGAFRQRRQGLAYRLNLAQKKGEWRPPKRVQPDRRSLKLYSKIIQHLRVRIAEKTKTAFLAYEGRATLHAFLRSIALLLFLHDTLYRSRKVLMRVFERLR